MALPMNTVNPGHAIPMLAGAAIGVNDCVKYSAEGTVIKTAGANEQGIGFAAEAAASGASVSVVLNGVVWARTKAAVSAGAYCEATADGEVQTESPANGTDQNCVGIALTASAAENELIALLITVFKYNNESV